MGVVGFIEKGVGALGAFVIHLCELAGSFALFLYHAIKSLLTTRPQLHKFFEQASQIGVESSLIVDKNMGSINVNDADELYVQKSSHNV